MRMIRACAPEGTREMCQGVAPMQSGALQWVIGESVGLSVTSSRTPPPAPLPIRVLSCACSDYLMLVWAWAMQDAQQLSGVSSPGGAWGWCGVGCGRPRGRVRRDMAGRVAVARVWASIAAPCCCVAGVPRNCDLHLYQFANVPRQGTAIVARAHSGRRTGPSCGQRRHGQNASLEEVRRVPCGQGLGLAGGA